MKISELEDMLQKDLEIDDDKLFEASIQTPALHAKWMKFATDEGYKLFILQQRMAKLKRAKWDFYAGRGTAILNQNYEKKYKKSISSLKLSKGELPIYVDGDDDIQTLAREVKQKELLVERLAEAVKSIQFRHTNIKNAIEWRKFQNGIS